MHLKIDIKQGMGHGFSVEGTTGYTFMAVSKVLGEDDLELLGYPPHRLKKDC